MNILRFRFLIILLFVAITLPLISGWPNYLASAAQVSEGEVVVSILPQKYFVDKISGGKIHVTVMVPPGASPATYEPRPRQMEALSRAQIYFAIGVPFEGAWLKRFMAVNPKMEIVRMDKGIRLYPMEGGADGHLCKILDPHTWLSPPLAALEARNVLWVLINKYPSMAQLFMKNYQELITGITRLDMEITRMLAPLVRSRGGKPLSFMVFHPSWGYFARTYGLRQISIEHEGKEPKPGQLVELAKRAKELDVKAIFIQPQFSARYAQVIGRSLGLKLVTADPLAYDWDENLLKLAKELVKGLK